MKPKEEKAINNSCFTNFDDKFHARLSHVIPRYFAGGEGSKFAGISARYEGRIKVEYQKDLMGLLEEGMLLAVRNFKQAQQGSERYTLMEISRVWPEHFGLRGLSDHGYYPMQFEVIEQSEADWQTDDKATMMIQISSIPINYDLTLCQPDECKFIKGFSYPIVASEAYILNSQMINRMYNQKITQKYNIDPAKTTEDAHKDPRLGLIKMFQATKTTIPIYIDFENLVRYHFGVFSFTGGGKSNLLSNILRRLIYHTKDTKVVIFDIAMEYPFLLQDVLADPHMASMILVESAIEGPEQLYKIMVKPRGFEKGERALSTFAGILKRGGVGQYVEPSAKLPTYEAVLDEVKQLRPDAAGKPNYVNAIDAISAAILNYVRIKRRGLEQTIEEAFVDYLDEAARQAVIRFKVSEKSNLYGWATSRSEIKRELQLKAPQGEDDTYTAKKIEQLLDGDMRLLILSIAEPAMIKGLAGELCGRTLAGRKREFRVEPPILFVFDEAQEFVPSYDMARGPHERDCTERVETLLRQGRKYGIGGCIATQRIAYLNTNALQQLHTYFVGPLPRPYDRNLVSSTFTIDQGILEKTLEFAPGEWLLSSYIATGIENVYIFIKADNNFPFQHINKDCS